MSGSSVFPILGSREALPRFLTSRQVLTLGIVIFTGAMIFLQWRSWQSFDWRAFFSETRDLNWAPLTIAIVLSCLRSPCERGDGKFFCVQCAMRDSAMCSRRR
jgi:hypothetical protein